MEAHAAGTRLKLHLWTYGKLFPNPWFVPNPGGPQICKTGLIITPGLRLCVTLNCEHSLIHYQIYKNQNVDNNLTFPTTLSLVSLCILCPLTY